MRIANYEHKHIDEVVEDIPQAIGAFHERNISASRRWTLANSAQATGNTTDELMAVLDYRTRRAVQRHEATVEDEAELVA